MSILLDGTGGVTTPGVVNTAGETIATTLSVTGATNLSALTTTGNTILGDASTDTLNVGNGGLVKDASGNVGIGTASPASKLHVSNSSGGGGAGGQIELTNTYGGVPSPNKYIRVNDSGTLDIVNSAYSATTLSVTDAGLLQFNSGYGSVATAYGCRAWVNFNGTGTVAIRASGNVSSITDNGTGDYTVNLTTALVDANGSVTSGGFYFSGFNSSGEAIQCALSTSSAVRIRTGTTSAAYDFAFVNIAVFR